MKVRHCLIIGLAAPCIALASACAGLQRESQTVAMSPALSAQELTGAVWRIDSGDTLLSFHEDGRYRMDPGGEIAIAPDYSGAYEIIDSQVHFSQMSGSSDGCPTGTTSSAEVDVDGGNLELLWIDHSCYPEVSGRAWSFVRISPENILDPQLPSEAPSTTFPAREGNLRGVWLVAGTSILVSFNGQGQYKWDESGQLAWAPQEDGSYSVAAAEGAIQLTVAFSSSCAVGDTLRLRESRMYSTASLIRVMEAEAEDDCGRLIGPVQFVLISS